MLNILLSSHALYTTKQLFTANKSLYKINSLSCHRLKKKYPIYDIQKELLKKCTILEITQWNNQKLWYLEFKYVWWTVVKSINVNINYDKVLKRTQINGIFGILRILKNGTNVQLLSSVILLKWNTTRHGTPNPLPKHYILRPIISTHIYLHNYVLCW